MGMGQDAGSMIGDIAASWIGRQHAPKFADYTPTDLGKGVSDAIGANSTNFAGASNLASRTNTFDQGEASRMMEMAIPGFGQMQAKMMLAANQDMDSSMSGNLPAGMQANLNRIAAEKGVTRGTSGGFNGYSALRDFGVSMMDWQNASRTRALGTMGSVYGMAPKVSPMSPMSMFVSPGQALEVQTDNNKMKYNIDQANYNTLSAVKNYNNQMNAGLARDFSVNAGKGFDDYMSMFGMGGGGGGGMMGGMMGGGK